MTQTASRHHIDFAINIFVAMFRIVLYKLKIFLDIHSGVLMRQCHTFSPSLVSIATQSSQTNPIIAWWVAARKLLSRQETDRSGPCVCSIIWAERLGNVN